MIIFVVLLSIFVVLTFIYVRKQHQSYNGSIPAVSYVFKDIDKPSANSPFIFYWILKNMALYNKQEFTYFEIRDVVKSTFPNLRDSAVFRYHTGVINQDFVIHNVSRTYDEFGFAIVSNDHYSISEKGEKFLEHYRDIYEKE